MVNFMMLSTLGLLRPLLRVNLPVRAMANQGQTLVTCEMLAQDQIAVIRLNDPRRLNTLSVGMGEQLFETVDRLKEQPALRVAILTGEGRAFSAGGDLDWLLARHADLPDNNAQIMRQFYKRFLELRQLQVPVIGAINGAAVGAGLCVALGGCDMRVASKTAVLGLTFVRLGIHPGMAATHFLPRLVGPAVAAEWLLTGKTYSAEEARQHGMVSTVCEDALTEAMSMAQSICDAAPLAVKATLETLRRAQEQTQNIQESLEREAQAQAQTYHTQDLLEGINAIKEKRNPNFKGC